MSGIIVLLVLAAYLLNYRFASQCLFASHEYASNAYEKGTGDYYFVAFWTIYFTFFRATFIKYFYLPLANHFNIANPSKRQRVAEQSYILGYYVIFGAAGLVWSFRNLIKTTMLMLIFSIICIEVRIGLVRATSGSVTHIFLFRGK
jgi:acyl-CoA-dependent ceramide synthase